MRLSFEPPTNGCMVYASILNVNIELRGSAEIHLQRLIHRTVRIIFAISGPKGHERISTNLPQYRPLSAVLVPNVVI